MKSHTWTTEEVDGGPVGVEDFWVCENCGACGGIVWPGKEASPSHAFYGNGSGLSLDEDCELSLRLIEAFDLGMECADRWRRDEEGK